jgi:D-aminoacyl-tRNA deacylase
LRLVVQRVELASVKINKEIISKIEKGLLVFLGIHTNDNIDQINYLIDKLINLRIFEDSENKMNLSVKDINGEILLISQFTLYANCLKGRRPSFIDAKKPNLAEDIYNAFFDNLKNVFSNTYQGQFGADMQISLINDGPVTIILDN